MQQNQPVKLNIKLDQTTPILCEQCESSAFQPAVILRKVSKFLSGTPQDGIIPVEVFACVKCGHINEEFEPKDA